MLTCEFLIFINKRSNDATKPADKKLTFDFSYSKQIRFGIEHSASSVPSESTFSESGNLQNKQRSSLDPQKLQYSMFLKNADDVLNSFKTTNSSD